MGILIDLTGKKYGRLTVIKRSDNSSRNETIWECLCECGNTCYVTSWRLRKQQTKSCGCIKHENCKKNKTENLLGKRYGNLTVVRYNSKTNQNKTKWDCECDCGKIVTVFAYNLKNGTTKSCGCLKYASRNFTHNMSKTRLYKIWVKMIDRCENVNNPAYTNYGGRGISVCKEWFNNFESFYDWANNNGYQDDLSIDRIDVNGNYEPSNCRWATAKEQANNTRKTIYLTYKGETKTLSEWCEIKNIKRTTLMRRIKAGWSAEDCLDIKVGSVQGPNKIKKNVKE